MIESYFIQSNTGLIGRAVLGYGKLSAFKPFIHDLLYNPVDFRHVIATAEKT